MNEHEHDDGWVDWQNFGASLLVAGPIFAFGYASAKFHLAWALGAVAWFVGAGVVMSVMLDAEDGEG